MYSDKFKTFIELWRRDYAAERTIDEKICADKDGKPLPWYTYPAIEYLSQLDYRQKKIFEYGFGFSSLFWAARAEKVISVEDNPGWPVKLRQSEESSNLRVLLREESALYENAIFETDDLYDVIIIDGKRRAACAAAAVKKSAPGGMIILDDSDRVNVSEEYVKAIACLKAADLIQIDFFGCCPQNTFTKTTSLFLRRNFNFSSFSALQPANGWGNLWSKSRKVRKKCYKEQM